MFVNGGSAQHQCPLLRLFWLKHKCIRLAITSKIAAIFASLLLHPPAAFAFFCSTSFLSRSSSRFNFSARAAFRSSSICRARCCVRGQCVHQELSGAVALTELLSGMASLRARRELTTKAALRRASGDTLNCLAAAFSSVSDLGAAGACSLSAEPVCPPEGVSILSTIGRERTSGHFKQQRCCPH